MTFKIAETSPTAAVATSGTIVFAYPAGTSAGDFAAFGHSIYAEGLNTLFSQDKGEISVAFTSDITVTYKGATSIPANSRVSVQLNQAGADRAGAVIPPRLVPASLYRMNLGSPDTADGNGYVESQNLTAAGVFSVNTTAAAAIAAAALDGEADVPRNVVAGWTNSAVLTVTGLDEYGDVIVESSTSGTSFTGKKAFKKVTDISVSANVTGLTVGTGTVLGLPAFLPATTMILAEYEDGVPAFPFTYDGDATGDPVAVAHALVGTAVAGVQTTPTATTGDVRGTYDPVTTPDGATAFELLVTLTDPTYKGVDNYDG